MRLSEITNLCHAVAKGDEKFVRHDGLLYVGRVKACQGDRLRVEAFGHAFYWDSGRCRPVDERAAPLGPPSNE